MSDYTETFTNGFDANQFNNSVLESTIVSTLISTSVVGDDVTFTFTPALSAPDVIVFNAIVLDMKNNGPDDIPETNVVLGVNISNPTGSDDITSGALVVAGGMGIAKNLNVGGSVVVGDVSTTITDMRSTELKTEHTYDNPTSDTSFAGTGVYEFDLSATSNVTAFAFVTIGDILYTTGTYSPIPGTGDYFISAVDKTTGVHLATYPSSEPIVVSGAASSSSTPLGIYDMGDGTHIVVISYADASNDYTILLRRYDNTTGALDATYGTVTIVNNGTSARALSAVQQTPTTVSVSAAGDGVNLEVYRIVLETGALDTSFGGGTGIVALSGFTGILPQCSAVQQDGSILCAGYADFGSGNELFVTRFDIDGVHDTSFAPGSATSGMYRDNTSVFTTIRAIQPYADNSICITGYASLIAYFVRLTEDGVLDPTFNGGTGLLTVNPGADNRCQFMFPVTVGYVYASMGVDGAIIRLNELGMDLTFAGNGYLDVQTGAVNDLAAYGNFHIADGVIYAGDIGATLKIAKFNTDDGSFNINNDVVVEGTVSTYAPVNSTDLTTKQYVDDMFEASDANIIKIKMLKSTPQPIPTSDPELVTWDTTEFNNGCIATTQGITIVEPGMYLIGYQISMSSGTNRRVSWMQIEGNATHTGRRYAEIEEFMDGTVSALWSTCGATIIDLGVNDVITVIVFHTSGGDRDVPASSADTDISELYAIKLTTSAFPLVETTASRAPSFELTNTAATGATLIKKTVVNNDLVTGGSGDLFQEFKDDGGTVRYDINGGGFTNWNLRDTTSSERGAFNINTPAGGVGIILNVANTNGDRKNFYTYQKHIRITHEPSTGKGVRLVNTDDTWSTTSDQRLKENIVQCTGDLDKMTNIHGYCYNYIGDNTERVGVIAQEVQAQYPIVVGTIEGVHEPSGLSDILVVKYSEMLPMLINTINELNTLIAGLKARLEVLESA
jgi:hypothetical protein